MKKLLPNTNIVQESIYVHLQHIHNILYTESKTKTKSHNNTWYKIDANNAS